MLTGATQHDSAMLAPTLDARLAAARARRATWRVQPMTVVVDERNAADVSGDHDRRIFGDVRAEAARGLPSVADVHDQDLRDTALTWLARAGCTVPEIGSVTGRSPQSVTHTLRYYVAIHPEPADNAIRKMVAWFEGQGEAVLTR